MRNYIFGFVLFTAGTTVGVLGWQMLSAQPTASGYSTKMILRADLEDMPGKEVLIFASEWAPGFKLPMHVHPSGHEFDYVVEGEQTFHYQGGAVKTVKVGEALYNLPNVPHFGDNATDRLTKVIVFRIKDKAQPISVEVPK